MNKKGGVGIIVLVIVIVLILGIGGYFLFFYEKCPKDQLFDPYNKICVNKNILCNSDKDCTLLEGQTVSIDGIVRFTLISATEEQGYDKATINVDDLGDVNLMNGDTKSSEFSFKGYKIIFEASDGDKDKIMGATFTVIKIWIKNNS